MDRLTFTTILALTAGVIYLVTCRNRRQIDRIPDGMVILCQPPGRRYVLYALGAVTVALVLVFSVLYFLDGAPEDARPMWVLCAAAAVLILLLTIFSGNLMARQCVYFSGEKIQMERPFQPSRTLRWDEIRRIGGSFDRAVSLYLADGTKVLTADAGMVNYELFCTVLKQKCPEKAAEYYRSRACDEPGSRVLRYGGEYYVLAVLGIAILLLYLAVLFTASGDPLQEIPESDPSQWFSVWFAPVCGAASLILLFVLCNTSVRYSEEGLVLKFPLRAGQELFWRDIRRVEAVPMKRPDRGGWKRLRIYTGDGVYRLDLEVLSHGRDGFVTELFKAVQNYQIPCAKVNR